jgi:hypothetical protein
MSQQTVRKIIYTCKICEVDHVIDINSEIVTNSKNFPVHFSHKHPGLPNMLTIFIDAKFVVRGVDVAIIEGEQSMTMNTVLCPTVNGTINCTGCELIKLCQFHRLQEVVANDKGNAAYEIPIIPSDDKEIVNWCKKNSPRG